MIIKQPTKQELINQVARLRAEVNNFPSYAVTAISYHQMNEIIKAKDETKLLKLINDGTRDIEQWDLKVDYMLIPKKLYKRFCKVLRRKRTIWNIDIIPVSKLKSVMLFANVESSE